MSQFMSDPSWSFLKITNGVLSLARNSLTDIETQFLKQESELTNTIDKLSKSFQQRKATQIPSSPNNLHKDEETANNELVENNFKNVELQKKPKPSRARKKERNVPASDAVENASEVPNSTLCSAKKPIDHNTPDAGINIDSAIVSAQECDNVIASESSDLNQNRTPESNLKGANNRADSLQIESISSPIVTRTRSRRKAQPAVVAQPRETRSRRRARKQETSATDVNIDEAQDSTPAVSAEIGIAKPNDSNESDNPKAIASDLFTVTQATAPKNEEVPEEVTRPKTRRGRKAATSRTTRQQIKSAVQALHDNEFDNSTAVQTAKVIDLTDEEKSVKVFSPSELPLQEVNTQSDEALTVKEDLVQSAKDLAISKENNALIVSGCHIGPSTSKNSPVVVEDAPSSEETIPPARIRQLPLSTDPITAAVPNTAISLASCASKTPGSEVAEDSQSSILQERIRSVTDEHTIVISTPDTTSIIDKSSSLPMDTFFCNNGRSSESCRLFKDSPELAPGLVADATECPVNPISSQSIPTVGLSIHLGAVTVPRQESLLLSLLNDDNMSDSEDTQPEEQAFHPAQPVTKISAEARPNEPQYIQIGDVTPNSSQARDAQSECTEKALLSTNNAFISKIDQPNAPFPYRFIPPTTSISNTGKVKSSPGRDASGTSSGSEPIVKSNISAHIRPPSFLLTDTQPLFISSKSNSVHGSKPCSVDHAKKSTPPVSGVLQTLLMKARADSMRRQGSAKPIQPELGTLSSSLDFGVTPTLSVFSGSELPSVQHSAALSHQHTGKPIVFSTATAFPANSLQSNAAVPSTVKLDANVIEIEVDTVDNQAPSKAESDSVLKSSTTLSANINSLLTEPLSIMESNDSKTLEDASVDKCLSPSDLDTNSSSAGTASDLPVSDGKDRCKSVEPKLPRIFCEDKPAPEDLSAHLPAKASNDTENTKLEVFVAPQNILEQQHAECYSVDILNAECSDSSASLKASTNAEDEKFDIPVVYGINFVSPLTDTRPENVYEIKSAPPAAVDRTENVLESDNSNAHLPLVNHVAKGSAEIPVAPEDTCLRQSADSDGKRKLCIESLRSEPVLVNVDSENLEIEIFGSPKGDSETESNQTDDGAGENEAVDDNQPERSNQTAKSESVWDTLYNGFTNISTNVGSFVRPKAPEAKTKRTVAVKALKLASVKRKRDMEREEGIKLRNKRFQEAGEERKKKALQLERQKENNLHAAGNTSSGSASVVPSRTFTKPQESLKKPAERLVELSTEERRKRAEERRLALEEEERRKRQVKEEQRQQQKELLKRRRKEEDDAARKKQKVIEEPSKKVEILLPDDSFALPKDKDSYKQTTTSSLQLHTFAIPQLPAPRHLPKAKSEEQRKASDPVVEIPTEPDPSDYESDEESDEKELRKKIPKWAQNPNLVNALAMQALTDPDTIFNPEYLKTCNLTEMFIDYSNKSRFTRRTSSGNWLQDRLGWREELEYKRRNGFLE